MYVRQGQFITRLQISKSDYSRMNVYNKKSDYFRFQRIQMSEHPHEPSQLENQSSNPNERIWQRDQNNQSNQQEVSQTVNQNMEQERQLGSKEGESLKIQQGEQISEKPALSQEQPQDENQIDDPKAQEKQQPLEVKPLSEDVQIPKQSKKQTKKDTKDTKDTKESKNASSKKSGSSKALKGQEEELQKLLKEKIKQIKNLSAKNSKLQTKYVELFKEQKGLKKDIQAFYLIVKEVLTMNEEECHALNLKDWKNFQEQQTGDYDAESLLKTWRTKDEAVWSKLKATQQQKQKQIASLKEQFERTSTEQLKFLSESHQSQNEDIFHELQKLKESNSELQKQITQLDKKLDLKNDDISKLTKEKLKLEHQVNQLNLKLIKDEFEDNIEIQRENLLNERNEFLKMRQEVEGLMIKRDQLKKDLKNKDKEIDELKTRLASKNEQLQELIAQVRVLSSNKQERNTQNGRENTLPDEEKEARDCQIKVPQIIEVKRSAQSQGTEQPKFQGSNSKKGTLLREGANQSSIPPQDTVQRQYLKNVLVRYLRSLINNESESETLLKVILTILKVSEFESKQIVQLHSKKRNAWWGLNIPNLI